MHTRWGHSVCASDYETHLVVTGSMPTAGDDLTLCKKAERYSILEDKWTELAEMHLNRSQHASCSLGNSAYVFCGLSPPSWSVESSIEKLVTNDASATWKMILLPQMVGRVAPGVAHLNFTEILILGGSTTGSQIQIYHTVNMSVRTAGEAVNANANNAAIASAGSEDSTAE